MTGEPIEVKYYYKKLDFNFSIYKRINSAKLNGKEIKITDDNIIKIEIPNKDIKSTELIVSYNIKITNKGELDGKATIEQQIPVGYEVVDATINSPEDGWTLTSDRTLERQVELAAGQTKEIQMTLRWTNNEDNLGTKTIISSIKSSENIANYSDTNKEDDSKTITIIVGIKTGLTSNMNIQTVLLLMVLLLVSAGMEIFVTKL